jgi:arginine/ornithine transport system substrate-binding protein
MSRPCAALALLLALVLPAQAADWKRIRVGVEGAYPPFSSLAADGTLQGFDIDIARALCAELKAECQLVQSPFDGMIPALQARKFDAIVASMSITDERRKAVDFTVRYYNTPNRFVARKGAGLAATAAGLKGKRIGVQRATIHDRYLTEIYKGSQIVRYAKQDEAFLDLASGRIEATLVDQMAASHGFLRTGAGKDFEFVGPPLEDPKYFGYGSGIAVRKSDADLRAKLDGAIAAIRANGTYKRIQDKYFDFDIYGKAPSP